MIDPGHPLWHPVVVRIFCLECEFKKPSVCARKQTLRGSVEAAIRRNHPKSGVPVGNQSQAKVVTREDRFRSAKDYSNKVVIKVRGPLRELGLLQCEKAVLVPRCLPEGRKRNRMGSK